MALLEVTTRIQNAPKANARKRRSAPHRHHRHALAASPRACQHHRSL